MMKGVCNVTHRLLVSVAAISLLLAVGPATAFAQQVLMVNVPFPFLISGRSHPAGEYRLSISENRDELTITPTKGPATVALVQTRLAAVNSPEQADRVVFDKVGDLYYLSELWLPREDGFLVHTAKEAHTHHTVKISRMGK
jgi:hypothetical protein